MSIEQGFFYWRRTQKTQLDKGYQFFKTYYRYFQPPHNAANGYLEQTQNTAFSYLLATLSRFS